MKFVIGTVLFVFIFHKAFTLQCWKCSSDIDHTCSDPFNDVASYRSRSSSSYDNSQSYNQRQVDNNYNRQYDPNYNRQYDQNYNRQYDQNDNRQYDHNYNPAFSTGLRNDYSSRPSLEVCDENEARNRRMKNVCLKEIVRGSNYVSVVRRCELIPFEQKIGTCSQSVSRGLTLDFCEYCDYDGCNSANGIKTNILIATAIASVVLFLYF